MSNPSDAPPSYDIATGSSTTTSKTQPSSHLEVPQPKNGIPAPHRRSMEDLQRPLPEGWVRSYDSNENHQFFVNTKVDPPQSYWQHPLDVPEVLSSLSSEERERLQDEENRMKQHHDDHSDDEDHHAKLPDRPTASQRPTQQSTEHGAQKKTFGEKLKDKVTGSTHEERVRQRAQRDKEEREYYQAHMQLRQAMQRAEMTGQPQYFAKDKNGQDIYIEPPGGAGMGYGGYNRGYGVNPYSTGPYANPNARFVRPGGAYGRPYGPYAGGGLGMPLAGGLLGGMLLGGLMF